MKRYRNIIVIVSLIVAALATEAWLDRRAAPPAAVTDFAAFTRWREPRSLEVIQQGGSEYLFATAPGGRMLKSGPPGYVFDRSGKLVGHSTDIGDDPRFRDKWIPRWFGKGQQLNADGARRWIESGETAAADNPHYDRGPVKGLLF